MLMMMINLLSLIFLLMVNGDKRDLVNDIHAEDDFSFFVCFCTYCTYCTYILLLLQTIYFVLNIIIQYLYVKARTLKKSQKIASVWFF